MFGEIIVVNVKRIWELNKADITYIGREMTGWPASVLANRYKFSSREINIQNYKAWLWCEYKEDGEVKAELERLVNLVVDGKDVLLGCWCAPLACHGDVIKACIEWMISQKN